MYLADYGKPIKATHTAVWDVPQEDPLILKLKKGQGVNLLEFVRFWRQNLAFKYG